MGDGPMSDVTSPPEPARRRLWSGMAGWVRAKDPDFLAIKRSARAAVVMPSVFAIAHVVSSNAQISLFGAFGSFAVAPSRGFPGSTPHASPLLRRTVPGRELFHFSRHGRLDAQGGIGRGHGRGGVRCPLRGDRHATGRNRIDRGTFALRIAGGGGPTGLGRWAATDWLGVGRRRVYSRLHVDLAHPVARQPPSSPRSRDVGREPAVGGTGERRVRSPGPRRT